MSISLGQLLAGLDAKRVGKYVMARCPAHDDGTASLSVAVNGAGMLLLHCFAGCEFKAIVAQLEWRGLWPVTIEVQQPEAPVDRVSVAVEPRLLERIGKIRAEVRHVDRTGVDRYLTNRGIKVRSPDEIRYHPSLWHPFTRTWWPAMVAIVRSVEGHVVGLHRTYLSHAEPVGKAPVKPVRLTLGPVTGHAIHLSPAAETLLLGEGIETTLSAMQMYRLPAWSAISAGNLVTVKLPSMVREVVILVDDDEAGRRKAIEAAWRFQRDGLRVRLIKPEGVNDFNDLLQRGAMSHVR